MNENIEFGILTQPGLFGGGLDAEAAGFAEYIVAKSTLEFEKKITQKKSFFGLFKKYGDSVIEVNTKRHGYCLRTGVKISYNPERPYSQEAFQSWNKYQNPNYEEKYCHGCGKHTKATLNKPLCITCYENCQQPKH